MVLNRNEAIAGVEAIIGYHFRDTGLLWEALQAKGSGVAKAGGKLNSRYLPEGNLRLAVYGDALLQLVLAEDWWMITLIVLAVMDHRRKHISTNDNLARGFELKGLDKFVYLPLSLDEITPRLRSNAMEAILGAVGRDAWFAAVRDVMDRLGLLSVPIIVNHGTVSAATQTSTQVPASRDTARVNW